MSQCSNCNQKLSCGCQKRNASNGVQVCTNCLSSYESKIKIITDTSYTLDPIIIKEIKPNIKE